MANNQQTRSSQWRGPRNGSNGANTRPRAATPAPTSQGRISQWRQSYDRYKSLAESTGGFDAVEREGYWQHAEHYIRMIHEAEALQTAP